MSRIREISARNTLCLITVMAFLALPVRAAAAGGFSVETWASGILDKEPALAGLVIRTGGELEKAKEALGIPGPLPEADFGAYALILIAPGEGKGGIIEIAGVAPAAGGALEVRYRVRSEGPAHGGPAKPSYPYLIAKLSPAPGADVPVRLIDEDYVNTLSSGTGLGQLREYTNVLSQAKDIPIREYLPLDRGNTWTYKSETARGPAGVTNTVVSESDGWSVFDTFFGVPGVGMKITSDGDILVSSKGVIKTFYNEDAVFEFPKDPFSAPAGVFGGVMVVTVPEGGGFWFRDVYAKGVGLVMHEQKSGKGRAAYSLAGARVGGIKYPQAGDSPGKD